MPDKTLEPEVTKKERHYKGYWLVKFVDFFPLFGFLLIVLVFGITTKGRLFNPFNLKTIWQQSFLYIIGGLGVMFCYAQGVHDFSLAANIALSAILSQRIGGENLVLTVFVALAVGSLVGAINGFIFSRTNLGDFILTLSMNFLISGTLITLMNKNAYLPGCPSLVALNARLLRQS